MVNHQQHKHGRSLSWSDLPPKLIRNISKRLKAKHNIASFRGVCTKWRKYSVPLPSYILSPLLPLSIPIPSSYSIDEPPIFHSTQPLILHVSSIYLIAPSNNNFPSSNFNPWLVMVEESKPGKLNLLHALTGKRVERYPPTLDLTRVKVTELVDGYGLKNSVSVKRVFLRSTSNYGLLEAMVFYDKGILAKVRVNIDNEVDDDEGKQEYVEWRKFQTRKGRKSWFLYLDDVVSFKGLLFGVDRKGKLYTLDHKRMVVRSIQVSQELSSSTTLTERRKRLVVDLTLNKLYMIVRDHVLEKAKFKVYTLNEDCNRWDMMESLGHHRVLFVGKKHSFFVNTRDIRACNDVGNCIVFSANCFTQRMGSDFPDRLLFANEKVDVGVYRYGDEENFSPIRLFPEFSHMIWPPPSWFPLCIKGELDDEEEEKPYPLNEQMSKMRHSIFRSPLDNHDERLVSNSSDKVDNDSNETHSASHKSSSRRASDEDKVNASIGFLDELPDTFEDAREATTSKHVSAELTMSTKSHPMETDHERDKVIPSTSTAKFQGVNIKSHLLPTLESIWAKYGNVIGDDSVCNKGILSSALESLANAVITLKNSTARTLTDATVDELRSNLVDLQRLGLKVDWLVPFVDKALVLQRSKPLIESIIALDKIKAEVEEREKKFLAESAIKKKALEDSKAHLSATIPLENQMIDLDEYVGVGLC